MLFLRCLFSLIFLLAGLAAGAIAYNFLFLFEKEVTVTIAGIVMKSGYIASFIAVIFYVIALHLFPLGKLRKRRRLHDEHIDHKTS